MGGRTQTWGHKPRLHVNFNSLPVVYPSIDPALEVGWNFNPDSLFQFKCARPEVS